MNVVVNIVHIPILLVLVGIVLLLCHIAVVTVVRALDFGVLPIVHVLDYGFEGEGENSCHDRF